jgi:hypothetical protein
MARESLLEAIPDDCNLARNGGSSGECRLISSCYVVESSEHIWRADDRITTLVVHHTRCRSGSCSNNDFMAVCNEGSAQPVQIHLRAGE